MIKTRQFLVSKTSLWTKALKSDCSSHPPFFAGELRLKVQPDWPLVGWLATCGNTQDGFLGTITTQFRSRPSDGLGEAEMRPEVGWLAKQIPLFISCI